MSAEVLRVEGTEHEPAQGLDLRLGQGLEVIQGRSQCLAHLPDLGKVDHREGRSRVLPPFGTLLEVAVADSRRHLHGVVLATDSVEQLAVVPSRTGLDLLGGHQPFRIIREHHSGLQRTHQARIEAHDVIGYPSSGLDTGFKPLIELFERQGLIVPCLVVAHTLERAATVVP